VWSQGLKKHHESIEITTKEQSLKKKKSIPFQAAEERGEQRNRTYKAQMPNIIIFSF